jgi:chromosome segregation ATPase
MPYSRYETMTWGRGRFQVLRVAEASGGGGKSQKLDTGLDPKTLGVLARAFELCITEHDVALPETERRQASEARIQLLAGETAAARAKLDEANQKLKAAEKRVRDLLFSLEMAAQANETSAHELETVRDELAALHRENDRLDAELTAFKMVADERGKMIPLLAAQNEDLRAQNQALMKQVDSMQQQIAFMAEHPICPAPPAQQ